MKSAETINNVILTGLSLLILSQPVFSQDNNAVSQLNRFVERTKTFKAEFTQILLNKTLSTDSKPKSGYFYLSRPGLFRWDYLKPYRQEIVSNGKKVWFYDPDLDQVTVKTVTNALSMGPALLLSGKSSIQERFKLEELPDMDGVSWLKLLPKEQVSGFKSIHVAFDKDILVEMLLEDEFDQMTRIVFTEVEINPQLKPERFEFVIPDGADVIED